MKKTALLIIVSILLIAPGAASQSYSLLYTLVNPYGSTVISWASGAIGAPFAAFSPDLATAPVGMNGVLRVPGSINNGTGCAQILVGRNLNTPPDGDKIYVSGNCSLTDDIRFGDGDFPMTLAGLSHGFLGAPNSPAGHSNAFVYFGSPEVGWPGLARDGAYFKFRQGNYTTAYGAVTANLPAAHPDRNGILTFDLKPDEEGLIFYVNGKRFKVAGVEF